MFRHRWRLAAVSLFALLLTACQVAGGLFDPPIAATITAQDSTSPSPRLSDRTIPAGGTRYYRVNVPTARDLLYGEAEGTGLRVRWLSATGTTLAVSESPTYFAGSVGALAAAAANGDVPEPSAIAVGFICRGPCAAIAPGASSYILSVQNTSGSSRTFDLFAYTFAANDLNDRGSASNQTSATAVSFSSTGTQEGAIELLGDEDWFHYTGSTARSLQFNVANPALGLRLRFADGRNVSAGESQTLSPGDRFYVYSVADRAGPSGTSRYTIQITDGPPTEPDPPIAATITAEDSTTPSPRLFDRTIPAGGTLYYRVNVPTARDLLYGEAVGTGLRVRWLTATGTTLAVSESPTFFAGAVSDLALAAAPEPEAIVEPLIIVGFACLGPCAAIAPTASTYYLSVHNTTNIIRTFNLFAYTFAANDDNDRGAADNQTRATATPVSIGAEYGAIELVGDRDWYRYTGPAGSVIEFSVNNPALGLRLQFDDGTTLTGATGSQTKTLEVGDDHFQVFSAQGRAGPSSTSGYTFQIGNP